jgi:hypothetical protein
MLGGGLVSFAGLLRELGAGNGQLSLLKVEAALDEGLPFPRVFSRRDLLHGRVRATRSAR